MTVKAQRQFESELLSIFADISTQTSFYRAGGNRKSELWSRFAANIGILGFSSGVKELVSAKEKLEHSIIKLHIEKRLDTESSNAIWSEFHALAKPRYYKNVIGGL